MGLDDIFHADPGGTDAPLPGTYAWLRGGRPPQPVRIWYGPPADPDTGEEMDRGWRWQMLVSGRPALLDETERDTLECDWQPAWSDVWPRCAVSPLEPADYAYLVALIEHAREHEPDNPFARPGRKIDLNTAAMPT